MWEIEQFDLPFCKVKDSLVYYWRNFVGNFSIPFTKLSEKINLLLESNAHYAIIFDNIKVDGKALRFTEPIVANVSYLGNEYFCQNGDLGIISTSSNLEECIKDFNDEVLFIFNEYGKEDDNKLTDGARELKRRILFHLAK